MLLQCWIVVLNDAKASHNEVHAFRSEPCWLFQLTLHAVFEEGFATVFFPLTLMRAGPSFKGMPAHAHSAVKLLHSALCFTDYCQHFDQDGSNKVCFEGLIKDS